ncbi:MAG: toll/interleukin-1 receptor domain-containing protein [Dactylosporangium sp.]|nr:toll/interleukin-1 receptor domain-containing protein [Dactylosporangium sp.]NNJ60733.1 toll/interleukin-1 receptor domain-containing protein [Dactylosporangium sp.]
MNKIFINSRNDDEPYGAILVHTVLSRWFGPDEVFRASESIPIGTDYARALVEAVQGCRVLLAVIGPGWNGITDRRGRRRLDNPDDWVRRELAMAFEAGKLVVPVLLRGAPMPALLDLPPDIAALAHCQYRRLDHRQFPTDVSRLGADLTDAVPGLTPRWDCGCAAGCRHRDRGGRATGNPCPFRCGATSLSWRVDTKMRSDPGDTRGFHCRNQRAIGRHPSG